MAPHYGDVPHPSLTEAAPFAVRWTGFMNVSAAALYTFQPGVLSPAEWGQSDRVRLWVDNQLLIDQWSSLSNTFPLGYTEMGPGSLYQLKMEYKCENSYPNNTYGCQYMLPMPPAVRFVSHAGAGLSWPSPATSPAGIGSGTGSGTGSGSVSGGEPQFERVNITLNLLSNRNA